MDSQDELEQARDEVHRKIGRNLLLFQHLEVLLKFIIANGRVSAPISQLKAVVERQAAAVKNKTLGYALGVFIENFHNSFINSESDHPDSTEIIVSYSLTIEHNPDNPSHHEARRNALTEILKQRNDLVHHLFLKIKPTSIESWREIGIYLDQQRERALPEVRYLQQLITSFTKTIEEHMALILEEMEQDHEGQESKI